MSCIKISELFPAGSELFEDFESFLDELSDGAVGAVQGGFSSVNTIETGFLTIQISIETNVKTEVVSIWTAAKTIGISVTVKTVIM